MTDKTVELIRRFTPLSSGSWEWDFLVPKAGRPLRWHEIENEYRVLIIADPGAGKTFEAMLRARKIAERGRKAFFIRIEAIKADFDQAFEIGTAADFAAWLTSGEEAWFFLDSVDEAQLDTPRALEEAVRIFGARIHDARERAHIFITSREDAWRALPDRSLVEQHIPQGEPVEVEPEANKDISGERDSTLKQYRLDGLVDDEIEIFASHYGIANVGEFCDAVKRGNLQTLAERPFDLKALIKVWMADRALGCRFDVLQRMIELQIAPLSAGSPIRLDPDRARSGARLLASAVTLTGKAVIALPDGVQSADRLDPRIVLPNWTPAELNRLLHSGLFDDPVYTSVRFRHREIRELLTAEWAHALLSLPGARVDVEALFCRESYGEQVLVPRMRSTLTWLILLDEQLCDKALVIAPEIASEGGDPSRLRLPVRRMMLRKIVEEIVTTARNDHG